MVVAFHSDGSTTADGFAAEYWCGDAATVGCTYPTATNYDPRATVDDGSCMFPDFDGAALRAAFGVAPNAAGWGELRGWGPGQNPCGDTGGGGQRPWEGVTCNGAGRVAEIDLRFKNNLGGFELGPALGNLTALTTLVLAGTQLSGTIPESLGHLTALTILDLGKFS